MCEQTEVRYLEGDIVWVKLGSCWWPGSVKDVDKLPEEILESLKKKPIAAVKFFQEDTFEYVRNLNQICLYNCRKKNEFIKKGLDIYRSRRREGSTVMDKFPDDVAMAERLTGGDPNIVRDTAFAPEEKPNYRTIFGSEKKSGPSSVDKKSKKNDTPDSKTKISWKVNPLSSPPDGRRKQKISPSVASSQTPRQITHPRFVSDIKDDSDHVRIRHQPVSTPSRNEQAGIPSPQYKCHICDFTSSRLNVIVIHNKFHSADAANNGQATTSKGGSIKSKSVESKVAIRGRGRPPLSSPSDKPKARIKPIPTCETPKSSISTERSSTKRKLSEDTKPRTASGTPETTVIPKSPEKQLKLEKKSPKTPISGKRKLSKGTGERPTKKKKSDEEIREKLLADWSDEDQEEEEKEIELIKQELSKSEIVNLQSPTSSTAAERDSITDTEEKDTITESPITSSDSKTNFTVKSNSSEEKSKQISCFDFDDKEDANLGSELEERAKKFVENRKIPRIIDDKFDMSKRRSITEEKKLSNIIGTNHTALEKHPATEKSSVIETQLEKTDKEEKMETEDIDAAFKTLLAETAVPVLPEVPELPASNIVIPEPNVESLTSLPNVILDSSNNQNEQSTVPSPEFINTEGGGDHDYSIKKEVMEEIVDEVEIKPKVEKNDSGCTQTSLEDDELELDINSMPVVMTDAIITEEPNTNKIPKVPMPIIDLPSSSTESQTIDLSDSSLTHIMMTTVSNLVTATETPVMSKSSPILSQVAPSSSSGGTVTKAIQETSIKTVKLAATSSGTTIAVPSSAISTLSKYKTTGGTAVISHKGGPGKFVIVQTSPSTQSRFTVGKTQQRVAVKGTQQQIVQQAVGAGKVVFLTKSQGTGPQKILTAISPQQQGIITGTKLQTQTQRKVTNIGSLLTPISSGSVIAKGTKCTTVSQPQIRPLQSGKQSIGPKFTMQSTQAKVILPSMQKASPVRVIGTLKPQSNTILIQTTQGATVSGTVVGKSISTSGQIQGKIASTQALTRLTSTKPKILSSPGISSAVQISVPTTLELKTSQNLPMQTKLVEIKSPVGPRMLMQKVVKSPLTGKSGGVGLLTNISQVKKVSGIFPRTSTIQKISHPVNQSVQSITAPQTIKKVITTPQTIKKCVLQQKSDVLIQSTKRIPIVVSSTHLQSNADLLTTQTLPSLQPLQPNVTVGPTIQQNLQPANVILSTSNSVGSTNIPIAQSNTLSLPSMQAATTGAASVSAPVVSSQQIAQVVAATPSDQLGDSGAATYVLVTIDETGALQQYDNSTLLAYDGSAQTSEGAARTLYIDPSTIGSSTDLENIILTIDNSASNTGSVLNLGQTSAVPLSPATSINLDNSSSSVFNIGSSPRTSGGGGIQTGGPNQDILAEALANTQVFQSDTAIQDSLTVVNSSQSTVMTPRLLEPTPLLTSSSSTLHQTTMILPTLSTVIPTQNPVSSVLETSLTLNQPIMTPLEVPSAVSALQNPPPVPSSLELPLTITQPALSINSQSFPNLPVTSSHITSRLCDSESLSDSTIPETSLPLTIRESATVSRGSFNPSMPLLAEEADCNNEINIKSPPGLIDQTQSNSYSNFSENSSHVEKRVHELLMPPSDGQDVLRDTVLTYTKIPEMTTYVEKENFKNKQSENLDSVTESISLYSKDNEQSKNTVIDCMKESPRERECTNIDSSRVSDEVEQDLSSVGHLDSHSESESNIPVIGTNTSDVDHTSCLIEPTQIPYNHKNSQYVPEILDTSSELAQTHTTRPVLQNENNEVDVKFEIKEEFEEDRHIFSESIKNHKLGTDFTADEMSSGNTSELLENSTNYPVQTPEEECVVQENNQTYLEAPQNTNNEQTSVIQSTSNSDLILEGDSCIQEATTNCNNISGTNEESTRPQELMEDTPSFISYQITGNISENLPHASGSPKQSPNMPLLIDEPTSQTSNSLEPEHLVSPKSPFQEDTVSVGMELDKNVQIDGSER